MNLREIQEEALQFRYTASQQQPLPNPALMPLQASTLPSLEQPLQSHHSTAVRASVFVVVDTNILLAQQRLLADILRLLSVSEEFSLLTLVVPWVVLQELDGLKKQSEVTSSLARDAIRFLHGALASRHPCLRGQQIHEFYGYANENDDRILDCCFYFQHVGREEIAQVLLFSDDRNLCVKSLVHGIRTISEWTGSAQEWIARVLQEVSPSPSQNVSSRNNVPAASSADVVMAETNGVSSHGGLPAHTTSMGANDAMEMDVEYHDLHVRRTFSNHMASAGSTASVSATYTSAANSNISTASSTTMIQWIGDPSQFPSEQHFYTYITDTLLSLLARQLPPFLQYTLEKYLGPLFLEVVRKDPPWSLADCCFLMQSHWVAVFRDLFRKYPKAQDAIADVERLVREWKLRGGAWREEKTKTVTAKTNGTAIMQRAWIPWRPNEVQGFLDSANLLLCVISSDAGSLEVPEERQQRTAVMEEWKRVLAKN